MSEIVIVSGARTPMGGFQGSLAGVSAVDLGAIAIRDAVARAGIEAGHAIRDSIARSQNEDRTVPTLTAQGAAYL